MAVQDADFTIDRKKVFNNALWTFAGQILPALVLLVALPILIRCMGVERFGAFTLIIVFFTYLNVLDLGIGMGLTRFLSKAIADKDDREFCEFTDTALISLVVLGTAGAFAVAFAVPFIMSLLRISDALYSEMYDAMLILLLSVPLSLCVIGLRGVLNARQRMDLVNTADISLTVVRTVGILLIVVFNNDLRWVVGFFSLTQLGALFLYAYYAGPFIPGEKKHRIFDIRKVPLFFKYGSWLTVSNIIGPVMVYFDRFVLGALLSIKAVPYYSVPYDFVTRFWVFPAAICAPFFPIFSALFSRDKTASKKIFMKTVRFLFISLFPLIFLVLIFAREGMSLWMGPEFAEKSFFVLRCLSVGVLINSLAQLAFNYILAAGRTDIPAKFHMAELLIYVPGLFFLITRFGLKGVAVAWVLRVSVDALLLLIAAIRLMGLEQRYVREIMMCVLAALVLMGMGFLPMAVTGKVLLAVGGIISFSAWLWILVMDKDDRTWVRGLFFQKP